MSARVVFAGGHLGQRDGLAHTLGLVRSQVQPPQVLRCKTCGCTTHWEPLDPKLHTKLGVNIRNFEPQAIGNVRIRLLDGAQTWKSFYWEDLHGN